VQVTDLMPGTTYDFRVMAVNSQGGSPWSPTGSATTLPSVPLAPVRPSVSACSSHSFQLNWREPYGQGSPVSSYTVNMARMPAPRPPLANGHSRALSVESDLGSGGAPRAAPKGGDDGGGGGVLARFQARTWRASPAGACCIELSVGAAAAAGPPRAGFPLLPLKPTPSVPPPTPALPSDFELGSNPASSSGEPQQRLRYSAVYNGPARTCEVRSLEPATTYSVRVRAHNAMGGSAWSEAVVVMTAAAAPGAPVALAVTAPAPGELRAAWEPPLRDNGAAVGAYLLEMAACARGGVGGGAAGGGGSGGKGGKGGSGGGPKGSAGSKSGGAAPWSKVYQGADTAFTVPDLPPGRKYMFRVRASSAQGLGPWSEPAEAATLAGPPSAPARPSVVQRAAAALKLKWALPAEDHGASVTAFVLQARSAGGGAEYATVYSGPELGARVDGLQPGTSYELRVAAANRAGQGPWSEPEVAVTALRPPPPPTRVTAEADEGPAAALRVSWEAAAAPGPAAAEAVGYEVEAQLCGPGGGGGGGALRQQVGRVDSAALASAAPGCTYLVHVRSVGAGGSGHSAWSDGVRVEVPASAAALAFVAAGTGAAGGGSDGGGDDIDDGDAGRAGGLRGTV
jgi:hypothetical protein